MCADTAAGRHVPKQHREYDWLDEGGVCRWPRKGVAGRGLVSGSRQDERSSGANSSEGWMEAKPEPFRANGRAPNRLQPAQAPEDFYG